MDPWYAFDLDGTLAYYDEWKGIENIGEPIQPMMDILREFLLQGHKVKIFTARANEGPEAIRKVQDWLQNMGLPRLEVTSQKDFGMIELWDDRCVCVERNTGKVLGRNE